MVEWQKEVKILTCPAWVGCKKCIFRNENSSETVRGMMFSKGLEAEESVFFLRIFIDFNGLARGLKLKKVYFCLGFQ